LNVTKSAEKCQRISRYLEKSRKIGIFRCHSESAGAPDADQSWQSENAQPDTPVGQYKGDPSDSRSSEWTQYRNQMGSKRWGTSNGDSPAADSLYDPYGNDWYVCSIYGSGASTYADFGVYCNCYAAIVDRHGRPYFPGLGRRMSPDSPFSKNLLDPNNLNAYNDNGGDPINNDGQQPSSNSTTTTVTLNRRPANIPGGQLPDDLRIEHEWISTPDGTDVGMGTANGVPQSDAPGVQTQVVDHTGQVPTSTQTFTGVDKTALATYTKVGTPTGPWIQE
jgi:hypothetical protein